MKHVEETVGDRRGALPLGWETATRGKPDQPARKQRRAPKRLGPAPVTAAYMAGYDWEARVAEEAAEVDRLERVAEECFRRVQEGAVPAL